MNLLCQGEDGALPQKGVTHHWEVPLLLKSL